MGMFPDKSYSRNLASYPEQAVSPSPREGIGIHLQKTVVLHPRGTDHVHLQMLAALRLRILPALRLQILAVLHLQILAPVRPKEFLVHARIHPGRKRRTSGGLVEGWSRAFRFFT